MVTHRAEPVRIVIAGEHPIFREGLRRLIETRSAFVIVRETGEGAEAVEFVRESAPDILLLGLASRSGAAVEMLRELAASGSAVRTIILTDSVDSPEVRRAVELGARAVVPKDSPPEVLFKSIESVMAGHFWIGREHSSDAVPSLRKLEAARRHSKAFGLTRREIEIVRAVVAGYSNREIAKRSSISENTVKSHLTHIFNSSAPPIEWSSPCLPRITVCSMASKPCSKAGVSQTEARFARVGFRSRQLPTPQLPTPKFALWELVFGSWELTGSAATDTEVLSV